MIKYHLFSFIAGFFKNVSSFFKKIIKEKEREIGGLPNKHFKIGIWTMFKFAPYVKVYSSSVDKLLTTHLQKIDHSQIHFNPINKISSISISLCPVRRIWSNFKLCRVIFLFITIETSSIESGGIDWHVNFLTKQN